MAAILLTPVAPTLESRAQVGLRAPRSISRNVRPAAGGMAIHHGGEAQKIDTHDAHTACRARVRGWQDFHMDGRGWVDLAYNWVVCQHGVVMVGRGLGVRSAANGTNDANDRYLAVCWLGGGAETPTPQASAAIEWLIGEARSRGVGRDVQPHRRFFATTCPGDPLAAATKVWATAIIGAAAGAVGGAVVPPATPGAKPATVPAFPLPSGYYFGPRDGGTQSVSGFFPVAGHSVRPALARWQARVGGLQADGLYGARTAARAREFQKRNHLPIDGKIGPVTWKAAWR